VQRLEIEVVRPTARRNPSGYSSSTDIRARRHLREFFVGRIRIGAHLVKWKLAYGKRRGIPPVHVFHVSIGIEEIVALPARAQRGQLCDIEFGGNFFATAEDGVAIVNSFTSGVTSPKRV